MIGAADRFETRFCCQLQRNHGTSHDVQYDMTDMYVRIYTDFYVVEFN